MTTIELQGELGINNAAELKKIFISALEKKQPITFDVSKLEDIDVSIVQLLYALYSEMDSSCSISYKILIWRFLFFHPYMAGAPQEC